MSLRQLMNEKPAVGYSVAGAVLAVAVAYGVMTIFGSDKEPPITTDWYYDLNTNELFAAKQNQTPPIEAPSGPKDGKPAGVRAMVFACPGECDDPAKREIAWLEMFTEDYLAKMASGEPISLAEAGAGKLIRKVDSDWQPAGTREAMGVYKVKLKCAKGEPKACFP